MPTHHRQGGQQQEKKKMLARTASLTRGLRYVRRGIPTKTIVRTMGGGHGHAPADGHGDGHDDHHGPLMPPFARLAPPTDSVSYCFDILLFSHDF
jgi:hypothetical protein